MHFEPTTLMTGAVLSAFAASFAGQGAFADPTEPMTLEARNSAPAICNSEDILVYVPRPSSTSESPCPAYARETGETARAREYLIATARPGYTMTRQGPERAIGRLHPQFVHRLAAAIAEARGSGLPFAGIFSAYRPPAFGVGGFVDKFHSLHTYGLAVDVTGIGAPGTPDALLWHEIAARHGVICPYGPHNPVEWNHCQPTRVKIIVAENPLRQTVTADGPISLEAMFELGFSLIAGSDGIDGTSADPPVHFFKPPQARTEILEPRITAAATIESAHNQRLPIDRSVFDGGAIRKPPISGGKLGWPKGVPRIANLDEELRGQTSSAKSRTLPLKPIVMPRIMADSSGGRK
jgi:hypothetical protein